jgi:hypothetical protein
MDAAKHKLAAPKGTIASDEALDPMPLLVIVLTVVAPFPPGTAEIL